MPYIIKENGKKESINLPTLSKIVNSVYEHCYGDNIYLYRQDITSLSMELFEILEKKYGGEPDSKWFYFQILEELQYLIANKKDKELSNSFTILYQSKIITKKNTEDTPILSKINWDIQLENNKVIKKTKKEWYIFFTNIFKELNYKNELFMKEIIKYKKALFFNEHNWLLFFENIVYQIIQKDPSYRDILRLLQIRKNRSKLIGRNWLEDFIFYDRKIFENELEHTPENIEKIKKTYYEEEQLIYHFLNFSKKENHILYKELWKSQIKQKFANNKQFLNNYDLDKLANELDPNKDFLLSYKAIQKLELTGCINYAIKESEIIINNVHFKTDKAFEPYQWVLMNLALTISNDLNEQKNDMAISFYIFFSRMILLPNPSFFWDIGNPTPTFNSNYLIYPKDNFDNLLDTVKESILNTRWAGHAFVDLREIRGEGVGIHNNIRKSIGINTTLSAINNIIQLQDRKEFNKKPVSFLLPIWHVDLLNIIEMDYKYLNIFIGIPNLFFEKLELNEDWYVLDPKTYPKIKSNHVEDYLEVINKLNNNSPNYKKIKSTKLYDKILNKVKSGEYSLLFLDNMRNYECTNSEKNSINSYFPELLYPVNIKPYEDNFFVLNSASITINLKYCLNKDQRPDSTLLKTIVLLAFKFLENSYRLQERKINKNKNIIIELNGLDEFLNIIVKDKKKEDKPKYILHWQNNIAKILHNAIIENNIAKNNINVLVKHKMPFPHHINNKFKEKGITLYRLDETTEKSLENNFNSYYTVPHVFSNVYFNFSNNELISLLSQNRKNITLKKVSEEVFDFSGKSRLFPSDYLYNNYNEENMEYYKKINRSYKENKKFNNYLEVSEIEWREIIENIAKMVFWFPNGGFLYIPKDLDPNLLKVIIKKSIMSGLNMLLVNEE